MQAKTPVILPWLVLAVAASLLSAVMPVGEALWSKILTISGEVNVKESEPPPEDEEGCSPGFWKNHTDTWPQGYSADDQVRNFLGEDAPSDLTLLEALELGGGELNALLRHVVAALLNSAHADIDYPYDDDAIIALFQEAVDGGDIEGAKGLLEEANEAGCPLPDVEDEDGEGNGDEDGEGGDPCQDIEAGEDSEDLNQDQAEEGEDDAQNEVVNGCGDEEDEEDEADEPCSDEANGSNNDGDGENAPGENVGNEECGDGQDEEPDDVDEEETHEIEASPKPIPTPTPAHESSSDHSATPTEASDDTGG
jgi:hypothetical protein